MKKIRNFIYYNFKVNKKQLSQLSIGNFYKWDSFPYKINNGNRKKFQLTINNNVSINLTSYM